MKYEEFEQMLLNELPRGFIQNRENIAMTLEFQQEVDMGRSLCVNIENIKQEGVMMRYPMDVLYQMAGMYDRKVALEVIRSKIMQDYRKMAGPLKQLAEMKTYEDAKPYLGMRLLGMEKSEKKLENALYKSLQGASDLALVPHLRFDESNTIGWVTPRQAHQWGVSTQQIMEDAMQAERKQNPYMVRPLKEVMEELAGAPLAEDGGLVLVSNEKKEHGAISLLYPGVLEELGTKYGDFLILPSSVHEVLILPDQQWQGKSKSYEIEEMVRKINETIVAPQDRLSDIVHHYDAKDKKLEPLKEYELRQIEPQPIKAAEELQSEKPEQDSPTMGPHL